MTLFEGMILLLFAAILGAGLSFFIIGACASAGKMLLKETRDLFFEDDEHAK